MLQASTTVPPPLMVLGLLTYPLGDHVVAKEASSEEEMAIFGARIDPSVHTMAYLNMLKMLLCMDSLPVIHLILLISLSLILISHLTQVPLLVPAKKYSRLL